jgi:hypothetical protein
MRIKFTGHPSAPPAERPATNADASPAQRPQPAAHELALPSQARPARLSTSLSQPALRTALPQRAGDAATRHPDRSSLAGSMEQRALQIAAQVAARIDNGQLALRGSYSTATSHAAAARASAGWALLHQR